MAKPLPSFAALRAFDAIGRAGGIRRAAAELAVDHSIVSRHLLALEAWIGAPLLDRRTGTLTVVGQAYHAGVSAAIRDLEAATASVTVRGRERHTLAIWCSAGFSLHWLAKELPDFARLQAGRADVPLVELRSSDSVPQFEHGEADGDIRYALDGDAAPLPREVRAEELARPVTFPVASAGFVAGLATPIRDLDGLLALPLIQEGASAEWDIWLAAQGWTAPPPAPVARYGQAHLALAAARAGQGVVLTNRLLSAEDLTSGQLIEVAPASLPAPRVAMGAYFFRCRHDRWADPALVTFRRWLRDRLAAWSMTEGESG